MEYGSGNRRGEDNAVNAEFQYKYDNEEVRQPGGVEPQRTTPHSNPNPNLPSVVGTSAGVIIFSHVVVVRVS